MNASPNADTTILFVKGDGRGTGTDWGSSQHIYLNLHFIFVIMIVMNCVFSLNAKTDLYLEMDLLSYDA